MEITLDFGGVVGAGFSSFLTRERRGDLAVHGPPGPLDLVEGKSWISKVWSLQDPSKANESPMSIPPEMNVLDGFQLGHCTRKELSAPSDSDVSSSPAGRPLTSGSHDDSVESPMDAAKEFLSSYQHRKLTRTCQACDVTFVTDADYARHQFVVHKEEKPFVCPKCFKRFSQRSTMTTHERTVHFKKRDHKCELCSAAFGQIGDLNRHRKTVHEGRRPHKCTQCSQGFGIRSQLKKHISTVHMKERPFSCHLCPFSFGEKATLKKHLRARHNSDLSPSA